MIRSVLIRNYRSIERSGLYGCGDLNIVIGKNNAGKSNVLSAIELMIDHLSKQAIAASWKVDRPADYFTHRQTSHSADIAVEFDLDEHVNEQVRDLIQADSPQLERAITELSGEKSVSFLLSAVFDKREPFLFLRQIATGSPEFADGEIHIPGVTLLKVPVEVAAELHANQLALIEVQSDQKVIEQILAASPEFRSYFENRQSREIPFRYLLDRFVPRRAPSKYLAPLDAAFKNADSYDEFMSALSEMAGEIKERVNETQARETTGSFRVFSGETKRQPIHVTELMAAVGSTSVLRLKESKLPIGPKEADALLQLKIRRGGEKKLQLVRETVNALLGVSVDAFQNEKIARSSAADQPRAEIDVDDFLVEANGAGVREALRIVLDFELNEPELVLIEEPEAHLHPGLARAIQHYLRDKSDAAQIFVTTHSTEFVDASSFQNVYLVARTQQSTSVCSAVTSHEEGLRIPSELGLRPSSLFMYDRIVFVEGSSDEEVFREIATKASVDFAKANVGFVHMGGVRNFAYFATEATLNFLTRRQVELLFVVDRDEREDADVRKLVERLGGRGHLMVLSRREIENFLLDPHAIKALIDSKLGSQRTSLDKADIRAAIQREARGLFGEALRLRVEQKLLAPIFLHTRKSTGTVEERLQRASDESAERLATVSREASALEEGLKRSWDSDAENLAPGSLILSRVFHGFGAQFDKSAGDSARLASLMQDSNLPADLVLIVKRLAGYEQAGDPEE